LIVNDERQQDSSDDEYAHLFNDEPLTEEMLQQLQDIENQFRNSGMYLLLCGNKSFLIMFFIGPESGLKHSCPTQRPHSPDTASAHEETA